VNIQFTGHPVVDYGLVSLRYLAGSEGDLSSAVSQLITLLTTDLEGTVRVFSGYLPNSVFSNPSAKATRKQDISSFLSTLQHMVSRRGTGDLVCSICGCFCPDDALLHARKDRLPFLYGDANFYPLLAPGLELCGLCALAVVAALPAMMQAGNTFLLMHVQDEKAALGLAKQAIDTVRANVLAGHFALHSYPSVRTPEAALLYSLHDLLTKSYADYLYLEHSRYPKTLWSVRSGNQTDDVRIEYLTIPHAVLVFMDRVVDYEQRERVSPSFVPILYRSLKISRSVLRGGNILELDREGAPNGAWYGHRMYLQEVMQMDGSYIASIERIGIAIAASPRAKNHVESLRQESSARTLARILHQLVADGAIEKEDARILLAYDNPLLLADAVRAVAYDYIRCVQNGVPFHRYTGEPIPADKMIETIERVAQRVAQSHHNLRSVYVSMVKESSPKSIRRTYVRWVSYGWMDWQEFITLCPIGEEKADLQKMQKYRDFLAACIAWHARQKGIDTTLPEEEES